MGKISIPVGNDYCPQTLFAYGTYREDGKPNFGLFCWFSYCALQSGMGVMACIGEKKLTHDRIRENKVFSANLITEQNVALADYFGITSGYDADKMNVPVAWEKGQVLDVPVLSSSPVSFELEVERFIPLDDQDSELLVCKIRNVLADSLLTDVALSVEEKMRKIAPVSTTCMTYFDYQGKRLGGWGELAAKPEGHGQGKEE